MANGSVYVFNMFSETMSLFSTNGEKAGTIEAWSAGGAGQPPRFTPAALTVGRVLNANEAPGHFLNGINRVVVLWDSGLYTFTLRIDGSSYPISQDLALNIQADRWQFLDSNGTVAQDGKLEAGPRRLAATVAMQETPARGRGVATPPDGRRP